MRHVTEDPANALVEIDGTELRGWIENRHCDRCSARLVYHERYDASFCPQCDSWFESRCGDASCAYCAQRPETPLDI